MFWAYSHWTPANSFLWAWNEMETMMVVGFTQFCWRMEDQFVKKIQPHSHTAPQSPQGIQEKNMPIYFLSWRGRCRLKKHFLSSLCFVWHNGAQLDTFVMCVLCSRGWNQGFGKEFFKKLKQPQQTSKQTSSANH